MNHAVIEFDEKDRGRFEEIEKGLKKIETRAGTEKYQLIKEGDEVMFQCGNDSFLKRVVRRFHWMTLDNMLTDIPLKSIRPDLDTVEQVKAGYESYPGYSEKIKQHGILGFELE